MDLLTGIIECPALGKRLPFKVNIFICCFELESKYAAGATGAKYQSEALQKTRVGIYLLQVNNRSTRAKCEICSKLTIKTPERRNSYRLGCSNTNPNLIRTWLVCKKVHAISHNFLIN